MQPKPYILAAAPASNIFKNGLEDEFDTLRQAEFGDGRNLMDVWLLGEEENGILEYGVMHSRTKDKRWNKLEWGNAIYYMFYYDFVRCSIPSLWD